MKKSTLLLTVLTFTFLACSEEDLFVAPDEEMGKVVEVITEKAKTAEEIFMVVEEQASFPGGTDAYYEFLKTHLKYPREALDKGVEGSVFLSFVVNTDGSLEDIKVIRGIGSGCDEAAVMALLESPNWIPAKQRGREVKARMSIKMIFKQASA